MVPTISAGLWYFELKVEFSSFVSFYISLLIRSHFLQLIFSMSVHQRQSCCCRYPSLSLRPKRLWNFPLGKTMHVCLYKGENGLVSEALISSLYYRKRVAMRPNLRAQRSMNVLIKTPDVPPDRFDSAGRNHHQASQLIEQCLAPQVGWWVIWVPLGLSSAVWYVYYGWTGYYLNDGSTLIARSVWGVIKVLVQGFFNLSQLLGQFSADIFRLRFMIACKASGTEKSRQNSGPGSLSRTESLQMRKRICCLFLLATAATFFEAAREQRFIHFPYPGGWSGLRRPRTSRLWPLHASLGPADNSKVQDICGKSDLCHWITLKPLSCWIPVIKHPVRDPGLVFHLTGTGQEHGCAQRTRMVAETEEVAPRAEESTLAASCRLRSGWPGSCPLHRPAAKPPQDDCGLSPGCTVSSMCVTVHVSTRSWIEGTHAAVRLEEKGRRRAEWTVTSLLSHLCSCRMTQRPLRGQLLQDATLCFFALQRDFQLRSNLPENKWPKEKACRNWDRFLTASRTHKVLRNAQHPDLLFPPSPSTSHLPRPSLSFGFTSHSLVCVHLEY